MAGRVNFKFSENVQRGILNLFKEDKDFHREVLPLIQPEYFEFDAQQRIFASVKEYFNKYNVLPTDTILVELLKPQLSPKEDFSDYEDELYLINSLDKREAENVDGYLDLVESFAKTSAIKAAIRECVDLVQDNKIDECEQEIRKAILVSREVDLGQDYFECVADRWERNSKANVSQNKIPCVFKTHTDDLEGGHSKKELVIVAAAAGVGKSLYLANQAVLALRNNKKVVYITLEMSEDKVSRRIDSMLSALPNQSLNEASTQTALHARLRAVRAKNQGARLVLKEFPAGQASVNTIRAYLTQLRVRKDFSPDVIIVDYLELLRPNSPGDAEYMAQQKTARDLRGLATEFNSLVITGTQVNRDGAKAQIIDQIHLGDSFGKIREADWGISLNQTAEEYQAGTMRAYVLKARDGRQKYTVPVQVSYSTLLMTERKTEKLLEEEIEEALTND